MDYLKHKILLDRPASAPALGVPEAATALRQLIEESEPHFAIGIFGGWGSGKTTLMNAIRAGLDPVKTVSVWFSAWRYEKESHLIIPLLDHIRADLADWAKAHANDARAKPIAQTTLRLGIALRALLRGVSFKFGLPGAVELELDAEKALKAEETMLAARQPPPPASSYFAAFQAMTDAFGSLGNGAANAPGAPASRIVVFIDDLDRCLPSAAVEILESMKLFFDFPGFVFVVGLDRSVVQRAVEEKFGHPTTEKGVGTGRTGLARAPVGDPQISGQEYIQKIFQIPYTVAPVATGQIDLLLDAMTGEAQLVPEQSAQIRDVVMPHLRYLVTAASVIPREVKRYLNAFTLAMKIKDWLKPDVVLALQTIEFRRDWRASVQPALLSWRRVFTQAVADEINGKPGVLAGLADDLTVPTDFLSYVQPNAPGHALLSEDNLDEYIFSGEATRSSLGPAFFELFPRLAALRTKAADGSSDQFIADPSGLKGEVAQFGSLVPSAVPGVTSLAGLAEISNMLASAPVPGLGAPGVPKAEVIRHLSRARDQLMDIYQAGRLSAP